jgi:DNA-binding transcriptional LysR family regulator
MPQVDIRRYVKHGTLPQLRLFEASARLGSFARAANELHLAPPTASVQIKKLTETVGLPLFEQIGKRIYLTAAGQQLYTSCRDVFRALGDLEQNLIAMRDLGVGQLRLGVTSPARYFVPRLLAAFLERHPGMGASLQIHNEATLVERLAGNEDDLYVFANAPDGEIVLQSILPNPLVVLARNDHALARERNIPFVRLAAEPFLMREPGSGTRGVALKLFRQHGCTPKVRMELSSNEAIREAILAGMGVSVLARHMLGLEPEPAGLVCLDVDGFPIASHWHFVYPVGKQLSPAAIAFMDFTRAEAKALSVQKYRRPCSAAASGPSPSAT